MTATPRPPRDFLQTGLPDMAAIPGIPPGLSGVFDVYRDESWAWLRLEGRDRRDWLTSVDLPPGSVVQTRLGSLDVVLLIDGVGAVDIFGDIASAPVVAALLDAA